jgi:hypothetical protein
VTNHFEPPSSLSGDPSSGRPLLVWVIALWYSLSALVWFAFVATALVGIKDWPASSLATARTTAASALYLWFGVELLRLRSRAATLSLALVGFVIAAASVTLFVAGQPREGILGLWRPALGVVTATLTSLYARHLRARGVLR